MKKINVLIVLSFAVSALALAPLSSTYAQVTGKTFRVIVVSSFGTTFPDCFRFDTPNTGDLTIDQLFQVVTYRHGQLDTVDTQFKSVSRSGQPLSIMFYGEEIEAVEQLTGEAVSEFGDTFVFTGPETGPSTSPELCVVGPGVGASAGASPRTSPRTSPYGLR
jgi:hypothetical protein